MGRGQILHQSALRDNARFPIVLEMSHLHLHLSASCPEDLSSLGGNLGFLPLCHVFGVQDKEIRVYIPPVPSLPRSPLYGPMVGFPGGPVVRNPPCNVEDPGSIPGPEISRTPWNS